jgi:erythromycin esterase-like protein
MDQVRQVREAAESLRGPQDLDPLLARTASARYVLIGEASHGTAEFYRWRAELTRRLIIEQGFSFVAVEGDWPDCHRLHCCVVGAPGVPNDPAAVLWQFERWPRWMWANEDVVHFAQWLRRFNSGRDGVPVGFHGLDVYSLWDSLRAILDYVRAHEPDHVESVLAAFRCFEPFGEDPQAYAFSTRMVPETCEADVVRVLAALRTDSAEAALPGLDPGFVARQNAEVVAGAERYYREMMRGGGRSWNVRDCHMADTLDRLMRAYGPEAKAVVWAHNTHVGDARATDMAAAGMVNIGQLMRERHAQDGVVVVGFGTYQGQVVASGRWGGTVRRMTVPEASDDSVEGLLHQAVADRDSLFVFPEGDGPGWARQVRGHRAIGVVYQPGRERHGNYVPTVLSRRYDAFVHCDRSTALEPLHHFEEARGEVETFPVGQ